MVDVSPRTVVVVFRRWLHGRGLGLHLIKVTAGRRRRLEVGFREGRGAVETGRDVHGDQQHEAQQGAAASRMPVGHRADPQSDHIHTVVDQSQCEVHVVGCLASRVSCDVPGLSVVGRVAAHAVVGVAQGL
jgi:hypothetical protein